MVSRNLFSKFVLILSAQSFQLLEVKVASNTTGLHCSVVTKDSKQKTPQSQYRKSILHIHVEISVNRYYSHPNFNRDPKSSKLKVK